MERNIFSIYALPLVVSNPFYADTIEDMRGFRPHFHFLTILFLTAALFPAGAQSEPREETGSSELFAPFVSRLQGEQAEGKITLTWRDSADINGGRYLVYRSPRPIIQSNFSSAEFLAAVQPGTEEYTDVPQASGNYYYAVIIEGPDQTIYDIFIPYRNITTKALTVTEEPSATTLAAEISRITATAQNNQVNLTFSASRDNRELLLYRAAQPFNTKEDLSPGKVISTVNSSQKSLTDYPVPGIPYYYALVDKAMVQEGSPEIQRGSNATLTAVKISVSQGRRSLPERSTARSLPLPSLLVTQRVTTGDPLAVAYEEPPEALPLSPDTEKAVAALMALFDLPRAPLARPQILPADRTASGSAGNTNTEPQDITLGSILDGPFAAQDWRETETQLTNYLGLPLSEEREARARFYLAQSLFYQGKLRNAFLEILMTEKYYPQRSRQWQDQILESLQKSSS